VANYCRRVVNYLANIELDIYNLFSSCGQEERFLLGETMEAVARSSAVGRES
jgi:hypothetical protein